MTRTAEDIGAEIDELLEHKVDPMPGCLSRSRSSAIFMTYLRAMLAMRVRPSIPTHSNLCLVVQLGQTGSDRIHL